MIPLFYPITFFFFSIMKPRAMPGRKGKRIQAFLLLVAKVLPVDNPTCNRTLRALVCKDHFEEEKWLPAFQSDFPCGVGVFQTQHRRENIFQTSNCKASKNCQEVSKAHAVSEASFSLLLLSRARKYKLVSTPVSVQLVQWEQKWYVSCSFLS